MLLAGTRPTFFDVREAADRPTVAVPGEVEPVRERSSTARAVDDVCSISLDGDSVMTPCVSTKGGPAAWIRLDALNAGGISTGSDGTELPVVPARSPDRL